MRVKNDGDLTYLTFSIIINLNFNCMRRLIITFLTLLSVHLLSAQFTLVGPPDSTLLDFNLGSAEDTATITWTPLEGATEYNFHLDLPGGDFSAPAFTSPAVTDTALLVTFGFVDSVLGTLGIAAGDTVDLIWTVTAEVDTGTTFADTVYAISFVRLTTTAVREPLAGVSFSLFPNPSHGQVQLRLGNLGHLRHLEARLSDLQGRQLWRDHIEATATFQTTLDLPELTPGLYYFSLQAEDQVLTRALRIE